MAAAPKPNALIWLLLSVIVIVLDQWSKAWVLASLPEYTAIPVIDGFWNWYRTYNTGAAFSFLADAGGWQLWFFTVLAVGIERPAGLLAVAHAPRRLAPGTAVRTGDRWRAGQRDRPPDPWARDRLHPVALARSLLARPSTSPDCAVVGGAIGIALFGLFDGKKKAA